ncbi:MAG: hypothetical protein RLZZ417_1161 [Bacteroidota bacterium]|jgi:hypothetical protein
MSKVDLPEIEYNSQRGEINIAEYGRNIQKMLYYAAEIEDLEKQRKYVDKIIDLMIVINPQCRNVEDFRTKLWKHAYRISDFKLKMTPPEGVVFSKEDSKEHPEEVAYPNIENNYRHYGHHIQLLIKKAKEMPEGPKKAGMINTIASYMKLAYKTWNRENYVSDESIKNDLATISKGTLYVEDGSSIDTFGQPSNNSNSRRRPMGKSYGSNDYGRNRTNYPQSANKNKTRSRFNSLGPGKRKPNT